MYCRYCVKYANGQRTPNGRNCRVINKGVTRQSPIPEKKGVFCKEFEFMFTFWCPQFGHFKNYRVCAFKVQNDPECLDCQEFEERTIGLQLHYKNFPTTLKRRRYVSPMKKQATFKFRKRKNER